MNQVNWSFAGNEYRLDTPYGVAIITELRMDVGDPTAIGARYTYNARFERSDGTTIYPRQEFINFDQVE